MCGFTAIIDPHHEINLMQRETWVRAMSEALAYRGRDDERFYVSKDKRVSGLFRRLPVQGVGDLGAQPMSESDYTLFFNGEIYNYIEIKQDLIDQYKCDFKSKSDAEVLLKAFVHWGVEKTVAILDGMFAILLCDHKNKKYYIINDQYGEKPLFYKYKDSVLYVSSSVQSFKVLPNTKLSSTALSHYLSYGFVPGPMSVFDDVEAIQAGQIVTFDMAKDRLRKEQYTCKTYNYRANARDPIQDFEHMFEQSLSRRLRSERKKGLFLSGGVDSALILAVARKNLEEQLPCYTLSFRSKEGDYDEAAQAKALAEKFSVPHSILPMNDQELARIIPQKLGTLDQPLADAAYFPLAALTDFAASDGCVVMLGGEGGDELQAGYSRHAQEAQLKKLWQNRYWLKYVWSSLKPLTPVARMIGQTQFDRKFDKIEHMLKNDADNAYESIVKLWSGSTNHRFVDDFRQNDIDFFLPNQLLPKFDNATMQATLEGRTPYLSKPLFDMMDQMPRDSWQNKALAKKILHGHGVSITPKKGLTVPIAHYLRGDLKEWSHQALKDFVALDVMPSSDIWSAWERVQSGKTEFAQPIWAIIVFSAWQRAHNLSI